MFIFNNVIREVIIVKTDRSDWFRFMYSRLGMCFTIIIFSLTFYVTATNDYMKYRPVNVKVIDHHESKGRYNSVLYLIVHNDKWGKFDIIVGPTDFHTLKKGDEATYKLREVDIKQTTFKNAVYFFGQTILWVCCGLYIVLSLIYYFRIKFKKKTSS